MPPLQEKELLSDSAAGEEVFGYDHHFRGPQYDRFWVSGADAELFEAVIIDDDNSPATGYYAAYNSARPLPAGVYYIGYESQGYRQIPCNFGVDDSGGIPATVTVTAPAGTLQEAFFDPVSIGTGVGADASNGVLSPTSFTVDGTSTALENLKWEGTNVTLSLSPYASLAGKVLDFIALDGTVSLSLSADDATVDATAGTFTWAVATQPWSDGDLLMLRIREVVAS